MFYYGIVPKNFDRETLFSAEIQLKFSGDFYFIFLYKPLKYNLGSG